MVKQKDLEALLHLSLVRDQSKVYDEAREKKKIGKGPEAIKDTELKGYLGNLVKHNFDEYTSEGASAWIHDYLRLDENKPDGTPGKKAFEEYTAHKDEVLSHYVGALEKGVNDAIKKQLPKGASKNDIKIGHYQAYGETLRELAQDMDREKIGDIRQNGSDEDKKVLNLLLRDNDFYKKLSEDKELVSNELYKKYGVRPSLFKVSDSQAKQHAQEIMIMDIRELGEYFSNNNIPLDKNKVKRFFGDSHYTIAKMARELPT